MTERAAKEKWCPMARECIRGDNKFSLIGFGVNRDATGDEVDNKCVASCCMMWRGKGTEGYCGLAGKP